MYRFECILLPCAVRAGRRQWAIFSWIKHTHLKHGSQSSRFNMSPSIRSTSVVLPLARGRRNARVLFVPREDAGESEGSIVLHRAGQHAELWPAGTHQAVGAAEVDEEPLLEEVLGVVGQQRSLADELYAAVNLVLRLSGGAAAAVKFGRHSWGKEENDY